MGMFHVWGGLHSKEFFIFHVLKRRLTKYFQPEEGFVDVYTNPDTFIFLHKGVQKVKNSFFKPSLENPDTVITNYLKGSDKETIWDLKPRLEVNYIFLDDDERNSILNKNMKN